jgi:hypothetical protein
MESNRTFAHGGSRDVFEAHFDPEEQEFRRGSKASLETSFKAASLIDRILSET